MSGEQCLGRGPQESILVRDPGRQRGAGERMTHRGWPWAERGGGAWGGAVFAWGLLGGGSLPFCQEPTQRVGRRSGAGDRGWVQLGMGMREAGQVPRHRRGRRGWEVVCTRARAGGAASGRRRDLWPATGEWEGRACPWLLGPPLGPCGHDHGHALPQRTVPPSGTQGWPPSQRGHFPGGQLRTDCPSGDKYRRTEPGQPRTVTAGTGGPGSFRTVGTPVVTTVTVVWEGAALAGQSPVVESTG